MWGERVKYNPIPAKLCESWPVSSASRQHFTSIQFISFLVSGFKFNKMQTFFRKQCMDVNHTSSSSYHALLIWSQDIAHGRIGIYPHIKYIPTYILCGDRSSAHLTLKIIYDFFYDIIVILNYFFMLIFINVLTFNMLLCQVLAEERGHLTEENILICASLWRFSRW